MEKGLLKNIENIKCLRGTLDTHHIPIENKQKIAEDLKMLLQKNKIDQIKENK